VANHSSVKGLTVRRNVVLNSNATGMYFGCHDGTTCVVSELLVEGNHIQGVRAPDPQIGYGLEVKLNSSAVIRGNVILDTKGPGIMVYGARDLTNRSVVERNLVVGSRTSSGIVVGGGPAVVRNNVAVSNEEAGIGLEDYRKRGLLRQIVVAHNTVYKNDRGGIAVAQGALDVKIVNNAVHAGAGTPGLPALRPGLYLVGNVECNWIPCFANPDGMDFSPFAGSLLVSARAMFFGDYLPKDDFFGVRREVPPTVGALEKPGGPIPTSPRP